jgi:hypothetical protein
VALTTSFFRSPELSVKCASSSSPSDYKSSMIFEGILAALDVDGGNLVKKVKGVFAFKVKTTLFYFLILRY